jgi:hypothetical protein
MADDVAASTAGRIAAEGAGRAVLAAAENAAKAGGSSSEFKATLVGILVTGGLGALEALKHIGGPVSVAAAGVSTAILCGAYALSRGKVKSSALTAAAAAVIKAGS